MAWQKPAWDYLADMMQTRVGLWVSALALSAVVRAQDLMWTELETTTEPPQPASMFKISGRELPAVPEEIKKLSEIAYAEVTFVNDGKRGLGRPMDATSPWLLQALRDGLQDCRIEATDGHKMPGASYDSARCYLIFNPASAGTRSRDSTPRALLVRSAVFPAAMVKGEGKHESWTDLPKDIVADVSVDVGGAVTDVVAVGLPPGKLATAVVTAVKSWKFAPARHEGIPIATTVRVPVLFSWPTLFSLSDLTQPPRPIRQQKPVYPLSERKGGFKGVVVVDFVVSKSGEVKDVVVYQSNNPNFNDPAIEAVRQWKFEPGYVGGRAVSTRMRVPMVFELSGVNASERYEVSKGKSSKLPPEFQNDFPPRVKNVALGVYPFEQLQKGIGAKVTVLFAVRPDGKVKFSDEKDQVLSDFDRAARAMVEEFEFVPASKDGKPNWGMLKIEVNFERNSEQVVVSDSARRILRELQKKDPAIFRINEVDQKPESLSRRAPIFPSELLEKAEEGKAMIEFFIDEAGKVQLPHVVSSSHPSFGYAAAQAASQWQFKPLTRSGKPVIVRAQVPFVFGASSVPKNPDQASAPAPHS